MIARILAAPFRVLLGLPPLHGMSMGNRFLQMGRALGLYRGPIHFVVKAKAIRIGTQPTGWMLFRQALRGEG